MKLKTSPILALLVASLITAALSLDLGGTTVKTPSSYKDLVMPDGWSALYKEAADRCQARMELYDAMEDERRRMRKWLCEFEDAAMDAFDDIDQEFLRRSMRAWEESHALDISLTKHHAEHGLACDGWVKWATVNRLVERVCFVCNLTAPPDERVRIVDEDVDAFMAGLSLDSIASMKSELDRLKLAIKTSSLLLKDVVPQERWSVVDDAHDAWRNVLDTDFDLLYNSERNSGEDLAAALRHSLLLCARRMVFYEQELSCAGKE